MIISLQRQLYTLKTTVYGAKCKSEKTPQELMELSGQMEFAFFTEEEKKATEEKLSQIEAEEAQRTTVVKEHLRKNRSCTDTDISELPVETIVLEPEGINDKNREDYVENKIDTEIVRKTNIQGVFPHFYISCPYPNKADILVKQFNMSYVEALNIMIYPAYGQFKFQGTWAEYKQYKAMKGELVQVVNAKDTDDDGSMIQYWVDKSQYEFGYGPYICPATGDLLDRDGLDGAHVEIVGYPNMGLFITPVQKGFNRSHTRSSFFVKPEYLVVAPKD